MSIIYISISDQNKKSVIGTYNPIEIEKSSLKDSIEKKVNELINFVLDFHYSLELYFHFLQHYF